MTYVWMSPLTGCDLCAEEFDGTGPMYDANIRGRWGNICQSCFTLFECDLGPGRGQKYELKGKHWEKVS